MFYSLPRSAVLESVGATIAKFASVVLLDSPLRDTAVWVRLRRLTIGAFAMGDYSPQRRVRYESHQPAAHVYSAQCAQGWEEPVKCRRWQALSHPLLSIDIL